MDLDEVVLPINGKKYWLWRAVDSKGDVVLSRLRSGLPTHLCSLSFKGQGTFAPQR